jgi:hypothetical protein
MQKVMLEGWKIAAGKRHLKLHNKRGTVGCMHKNKTYVDDEGKTRNDLCWGHGLTILELVNSGTERLSETSLWFCPGHYLQFALSKHEIELEDNEVLPDKWPMPIYV